MVESIADKLKIVLVGDSTVCDYEAETSKALDRQGWGMQLKNLIQNSQVINLALSGRSSRSFLVEENYKRLEEELCEKAYLLIQFGHNDEKIEDPNRGTYPHLVLGQLDEEGKDDTGRYSFEWMLLNKYIKLAWEKGATPILVTPIARRMITGQPTIEAHQTYIDGIKRIAEEHNIQCIDLANQTKKLYDEMYVEGGSRITAHMHAFKDEEHKEIDNTHLSKYGAEIIAHLVVKNLFIESEIN
nr:GDSL-type esterase/lipase family protein [uncultured Cellulosilyticum sp.]